MKILLQIWFLVVLFVMAGCDSQKADIPINVGISAQYPPFAYIENDKIVGFEVELVDLILKKLNRKSNYADIQFNSIMPSIDSELIDIGLGAITITDERKKNFDFSMPYYFDGIGANFLPNNPPSDVLNLNHKKIGVQLGTTQELWTKEHLPNNEIINMDSNAQLVEALKNKQVDIIIIDESQGQVFSKKNNLGYIRVEKAKDGYGMMFKKNSSLVPIINTVLSDFEKNGTIRRLENKWFAQK